MKRALLIALAIAATAGIAHAYPQYQLSREQTCGACHLSPTGGGLLNDNGELTDEDDARWGGDPTFLHGAAELPEWLHLGGDVRAAAGASDRGGGIGPAAFPMQLEGHVQADRGPISVVADLGFTIPNEDSPITALWSRSHYVEWHQQDAGEGLYARAGRFMPTYGLRLAEHTAYTRRFGGTPLFSEAYGASVGWVTPGAELHVTGFVHDRWQKSIEDGDGAALHAEKRFGKISVGAQARYANGAEDVRTQGGATAKLWLDGPEVLLQAEAQVVHQTFDAGGKRNQAVAYLMASWFFAHSYFLDVGLGHFDQDVKVPDVDRDTVEVNLHWFPKAHIELVLMGRLQMIALGKGGDNASYGLVQFHYRL